jgi:hypothetical protein
MSVNRPRVQIIAIIKVTAISTLGCSQNDPYAQCDQFKPIRTHLQRPVMLAQNISSWPCVSNADIANAEHNLNADYNIDNFLF